MSDVKKIRVLIVEDEKLAAEADRILLESAGYEVIGNAEDGLQALEQTIALKPDVILLDIKLPGMDGLAAARRINRVQPTPIVVLTADERPQLVEEAGRVGVGAFLIKPPSAKELDRAITVARARFADLAALRKLNEQLAAEMEARAKRENEYRTIIRTTADGFWLMDKSGRFLEGNQALADMLGYSLEELASIRLQDIEARETAVESERHMEEIIIAGSARFETRHRRKDGRIIAVEVSTNYLADEEKFIVFIRDITARKQAEEDLKESASRLRNLLDESPYPLIVTDLARNVVLFINQPGADLFEVDKQAILGADTMQFYGAAGLRDSMMALLRRNGAIKDQELIMSTLKGNLFHARISVNISRYEGKEAALISVTDITSRMRAEEALRESELNFRTLADSGQALIWTSGPDKKCDYFNQPWLAFTGRSLKQELGDGWVEGVHPDDLNRCIEIYSTAFDRRERFSMDYRLRSRDGQYRWIQDDGTPRYDSQGNFLGYLGHCLDITDRKHGEESLRESERRYRDLFENAPVGIFTTTFDGKPLQINPTMARILGFHSIEETLKHYSNLAMELYLRPERRDDLTRMLKENGKVENFEYEARTHDHRRIWINMNAQLGKPDTDGTLVVEGFSTDITGRKRAEEEIQRNVARLHSQINIQQYQTETVQEFLDYALGEALGLTGSRIGYIYFYSEEKREFTLNTWSKNVMRQCTINEPLTVYQLESTGIWGEAVRQRKPLILNDFHSPHPLKKGYPEGHAALIRFMTTPVFVENRIVAVVGVGNKEEPYLETDLLQLMLLMDTVWKVVERKRSEEEKKHLEDQLQQAMKMEAVGRLAGGVAHDFNNLLTGISGYTELLLSDLNPSDPMHADLIEIQRAAESAAMLTRQLLAFSRKQLIEPKVIDLNELIVTLHKMLVRLIGEDIELKTVASDQLGPVKVDPGQFEQILINLAVNARDAMPNGGKLLIETANIELDEEYCFRHPHVQPGSYVMLAVSDTGHGMNEDVKEHLFEPFFTTKPKGRGTGLGLATIYGTVKQSGGSIEVYSEEGHGTTFKIYLPRLTEQAIRLEEKNYAKQVTGGNETILVVEDEGIVRDLAIKILSGLGYRVLQAPNGEQACHLVNSYTDRINLLVTDVVMPGMNGRQLAERLVTLQPEMKVLYTSGYTENAIAHHGIIDEGLNFIGKPYSPYSLAKKVREVLG